MGRQWNIRCRSKPENSRPAAIDLYAERQQGLECVRSDVAEATGDEIGCVSALIVSSATSFGDAFMFYERPLLCSDGGAEPLFLPERRDQAQPEHHHVAVFTRRKSTANVLEVGLDAEERS